jgi:hypothetical protein
MKERTGTGGFERSPDARLQLPWYMWRIQSYSDPCGRETLVVGCDFMELPAKERDGFIGLRCGAHGGAPEYGSSS